MTQPRSKKKIAASLTLAAALLAGAGYKAGQLAADPSAEKDCDVSGLTLPAEATLRIGPNAATTVHVRLAPHGAAPAASARLAAPVRQESIPWKQQGGTINDASCLNRTVVYGIAQIKTVDDVRNALAFARENKLKVSIAAVRHSMGGHAFAKGALVLDMLQFNQMSLNSATADGKPVLTVQSGATWHDIQNYLHPRYAVKAMQSSDIFSVGGSISVNAHGMDHRAGSVGDTLLAMRIMRPDGTVVTASRTENPELFHLAVGGYGLFGVILDADLEVTANEVYQTHRQVIPYQNFPAVFESELLPDDDLGLFYGHLSTSPGSLLEEMILYRYTRVEAPEDPADFPPLGEVSSTRLRRLVFNFSKLGDFPMRVKWWAEKTLEPRLESCSVTPRTQAMAEGEACLVTRNEPMHDSVPYIRNELKHETDILQEYFIPRSQFIAFIDELRQVVREDDVNLINASVRVVHKGDNFLSYAPEDMFSVVLYINQPTTPQGNAHMQQVTRKLIDLTHRLGGRFFLPYQLHYTPEQLRTAYPEIDRFFEMKRTYDPQELLTNTFYETYAR